MSQELKELRLKIARMEGAARRLLDKIGCAVDARKGPEATLEALRDAADVVGREKESGGTGWKF